MRSGIPTTAKRLRCGCGNIQIIHRRKDRDKRAGHCKPLWCFKCEKRTKHVELGLA